MELRGGIAVGVGTVITDEIAEGHCMIEYVVLGGLVVLMSGNLDPIDICDHRL